MSYDLIVRAKRDLSPEEIAQVRDVLHSAADALDGDVLLSESGPKHAGERLGLLALGLDLSESVSSAHAEALNRLVDVAVQAGIEIYDPQQSAPLTKVVPHA